MAEFEFIKKVLQESLSKNFEMIVTIKPEVLEFELFFKVDFERQMTVNCQVRKLDLYGAEQVEGKSSELIRGVVESLVYSLMTGIRDKIKLNGETNKEQSNGSTEKA